MRAGEKIDDVEIGRTKPLMDTCAPFWGGSAEMNASFTVTVPSSAPELAKGVAQRFAVPSPGAGGFGLKMALKKAMFGVRVMGDAGAAAAKKFEEETDRLLDTAL